MKLKSSDFKRSVEIGEDELWRSIFLTAEKRLGLLKHKMTLALRFLETGKCSADEAMETARQINLLRDAFSRISVDKAIYKSEHGDAPWKDNLSPVVTSCGNLYTTVDGKDLLYEVVCVLVYAHYAKKDVYAE